MSYPTVSQFHFAAKHGGEKNDESLLLALPSELLKHCLVDYMDWGDLAKLSTVQSSWKDLLHDAALFGGREAKWELAEALLHGTRGLETNPQRATQLFRELTGIEMDEDNNVTRTSLPFAPAMKRLAECYLDGNGVEADSSLAVSWLTAAYDVGDDVHAAYQLAVLYEKSSRVETDVYRAAEWFHKAAQRGHMEAMAEYGLCCELGCGREQSDQEALEWYMKAANMGHVTAKYSVGEAFEEARGVPQSDEEACLWYYKAAVDGDLDSKKALRRLHDIARIVVPGVGAILNV